MMNKSEYLELIKQVNHYNYLYSVKNQPIITDTEYDELYFKLQQYEADHPEQIDATSPTQTIIENLNKQKIKHIYPELSLNKANTLENVTKFLKKFQNNDQFHTDDFMVQLKEDGATVVLYYNILKKNFVAATRGGGYEGNDVSLQMDTYKNQIPNTPAIVRGEIILTNEQFDLLNHQGAYNNPRNAIAGLLNHPAPIKNARFIAYNIENAEDLGLYTEQSILQQLTDWGFTTPSLQEIFPNTTNGHEALIDFIQNFEQTNQRQELDHDIDGLVIKPTYIKNRREIGVTSHHPKNQLAYKFTSPDAITTLRAVEWQTGSKGRLTPVGIFDEVEIFGSKIQKASLSTLQNIQQRDLKINDQILVRLSNDVIPQIVKSFADQRTGDEITIETPKNSYFNGLQLYSYNPQNQIMQWQNFIGKNGFDFKNVSLATIKQLSEAKLINPKVYASLWQLSANDLKTLPGWQNKKINNLMSQLTPDKEISLAQAIFGLNLAHIGVSTSNALAKVYQTIDNFIQNTPVIPKTQWKKYKLFSNIEFEKSLTNGRVILNDIQKYITIKDVETPIVTNQPTHTFVITGKDPNMKRQEYQKMIESQNQTVQSKVTSKTDYLVVLDDSKSSTKYLTAQHLNVKIISKSELMTLLNKLASAS